MTQKFKGELEIDAWHGVIYFHERKTGRTMLRICQLHGMPFDVTQKFKGELGIDARRGVIYFHNTGTGRTMLRVCQLRDIPFDATLTFVDITICEDTK